jgi:hypothetical protein
MSRRASIFSKILPYIDKDDWEEYDDFIVFGREAFRALGTRPPTGEEERDQVVCEDLDAFFEKISRQRGLGLATERTTLDGATPVDLSNAMKDLHPETLETMAKAIESKLAEQGALPVGVVPHSDAGHYDALDRHYAEQVISKLSRIVRLVSAIEPVEAGRNSVPAVRGYFAEVHNCFLYGFHVACAVLCRALLEVALEERLEPRKGRRRRKPSNKLDAWGRAKSDILRRLDHAEAKGILDGSRVEAGTRVKDAGDAAIHRLVEFQSLYDTDDKVWTLIDETRLVLEDLYRPTPAT